MINKLKTYLNDSDCRIGKIGYVAVNPADYKIISTDKDYCKATDTFCGTPVIVNTTLRSGDIEVWS